MDRTEDDVAGFGRLEGRAKRLGVAHLADQDDVGILTDHRPERRREVGHVDADLPLVDEALLLGEQKLDRVLDGEDVLGAALVDVVEQRRHGRALAASRDAGHEDQPPLGVGRGPESRSSTLHVIFSTNQFRRCRPTTQSVAPATNIVPSPGATPRS
jgi:hypothetical protein